MVEPATWTEVPAATLQVGDVVACRELLRGEVRTVERGVVRVWRDAEGLVRYETDGGEATMHARAPHAPVRLVERAIVKAACPNIHAKTRLQVLHLTAVAGRA